MPRPNRRTPAPSLTANASRPRAALLLAGWAVVTVAATMAVLLAAEIRATLPLVALGFAAGGLMMVAAGVFGAWTAVRMLTLSNPILTIGPEGLRDLRLSPATLPWDAIRWKRVTVSRKRQAADAVQFHLDADLPLTPPARALALFNRLMRYPPLTVQAMGLDTTTDAIAAACARHKPPIEGPPPAR